MHPLSLDVEVTLQNFGENALAEPGNRWNDSEEEVVWACWHERRSLMFVVDVHTKAWRQHAVQQIAPE
jgi:hypothetical protein